MSHLDERLNKEATRYMRTAAANPSNALIHAPDLADAVKTWLEAETRWAIASREARLLQTFFNRFEQLASFPENPNVDLVFHAGELARIATHCGHRRIPVQPCPACSALFAAEHETGCDWAQCMITGAQRIQCDCDEGCGEDIWTGEDYATTAARRYGWFCYFGPDYGEAGWVPTNEHDPRARPDLNRVGIECYWDATAQTWEKKKGRTPENV